jgi:predicted enzyme related to lactoylglutathione lyase
MARMTSRIAQWTLDVQDIRRMADFWSAALGYVIEDDDGTVHLRPPGGGEPSVWLQPGAGPKQGKNRDHLDLRTPDVGDEVERLLALGARHVDVGQKESDPFVVLADPEGNEFCVLR